MGKISASAMCSKMLSGECSGTGVLAGRDFTGVSVRFEIGLRKAQ
jgi:hypothetical protein